VFTGQVEVGILLDGASNSVVDNDLAELVAEVAVIELGPQTTDGQVAGNQQGQLDGDEALAGVVQRGASTTFEGNTFPAGYPGWTYGADGSPTEGRGWYLLRARWSPTTSPTTVVSWLKVSMPAPTWNTVGVPATSVAISTMWPPPG